MWHCRFGIHIYSTVRSNIVVIYVWLWQLNQILASLKWSPTGTDFEIYGVVVQEGKKQPFNVVDEELNEKTMLRTCLFFKKIDFFFLRIWAIYLSIKSNPKLKLHYSVMEHLWFRGNAQKSDQLLGFDSNKGVLGSGFGHNSGL